MLLPSRARPRFRMASKVSGATNSLYFSSTFPIESLLVLGGWERRTRGDRILEEFAGPAEHVVRSHDPTKTAQTGFTLGRKHFERLPESFGRIVNGIRVDQDRVPKLTGRP